MSDGSRRVKKRSQMQYLEKIQTINSRFFYVNFSEEKQCSNLFMAKILTKMPIGMRIQAMAETELKSDMVEDRLEQEFGELETKVVNRIRVFFADEIKKEPGVTLEIAADNNTPNDTPYILFLNSDGKWSFEVQDIGISWDADGKAKIEDKTKSWEIGEKPNLSNLLNAYLLVTDPAYRGLDLEMRDRQIYGNKEKLTGELTQDLQELLDELS